MNYITKISLFDDSISNLSSNEYFINLMNQLHQKNNLNLEQIQQMQLDLLQLLSKQVIRYTSGESSSVTTEKASQILGSIYYGIGIYLKSLYIDEQIELIKNEKLDYLYQEGITLMKDKILIAKQLLDFVQKNAIHTKNQAYYDTIFNGLPLFFRDYDMKFAAQEDAGSIDYPLMKEIENVTGIEYILEYLVSLNFENSLLKYFKQDSVEKLLRGYNKNYKDLLINITELVITNALGLIVVGKDFIALNFTDEDRSNLIKRWFDKKEEDIYNDLLKAYESFCFKLELQDLYQISYLKNILVPLSKRILINLEINHLDTIFISFLDEIKEVSPIYEEGQLMLDEDLREFIEEIRECRFVSDKIAMITERVHSLSDLIEILQECFFGSEYQEVLQLLNDIELSVIRNYLNSEQMNNEFYYIYEPTQFFEEYNKFINNLDDKRKQLIESLSINNIPNIKSINFHYCKTLKNNSY